MAFSVNQVFLVGNVASDPELRFTTNGNPVLNFSMATNHSIKKDDEWEDVATFHRIIVWGKVAEYLGNTLKKGQQVSITGRIQNRSYEDKQGVTRYISEIVAKDVIPPREKKDQFEEDVSEAMAPDEPTAEPEVNEGTYHFSFKSGGDNTWISTNKAY